jgi:macrophage erythroblast attacher
VDVDLFVTANKVEKALEDHNVAPCLAWCHEHKSRLRKLKVSSLSIIVNYIYGVQ